MGPIKGAPALDYGWRLISFPHRQLDHRGVCRTASILGRGFRGSPQASAVAHGRLETSCQRAVWNAEVASSLYGSCKCCTGSTIMATYFPRTLKQGLGCRCVLRPENASLGRWSSMQTTSTVSLRRRRVWMCFRSESRPPTFHLVFLTFCALYYTILSYALLYYTVLYYYTVICIVGTPLPVKGVVEYQPATRISDREVVQCLAFHAGLCSSVDTCCLGRAAEPSCRGRQHHGRCSRRRRGRRGCRVLGVS